MFENEKINDRELLQDIKKIILSKSSDQITDNTDLILSYFALDAKTDMENHPVAIAYYKKMGWNEYKYFDVINSFYTTFVCALVAFSNTKEPYYMYFEKYNHPDWNWKIFDYGNCTELSYATAYGLCDISKANFSKKAINSDYLLHDILNEFKRTDNGKKIEQLASLSHCVANFMPCPSAYEYGKLSYNQLKGILPESSDYLPMFIDKIQCCYEQHSPLVYRQKMKDEQIGFETIAKWHNWFKKNQTTYCLDDYYQVKENRIIGKPFFTGQNLLYPIPKTEKEVCECLNSILKRIQNRAKLISQRGYK